MANINLINEIANKLQLNPQRLQHALLEGGKVQFPKVHYLTSEQLEAKDKASREAGKAKGIEEGQAIARELVAKDLKREIGLSIDGKNLDSVIKEAKKYISNSDQYRKEQIELLNRKIEALDSEADRIKSEELKLKHEAYLQNALPIQRKKSISDQEYIQILSKELQIIDRDGQQIIMQKGNELLNPYGKPKDPVSHISEVFEKRNWIEVKPTPAPQGRGWGNTPSGGKATRMSELVREYETSGKNMTGLEFQKDVSELSKDNPGFFDM